MFYRVFELINTIPLSIKNNLKSSKKEEENERAIQVWQTCIPLRYTENAHHALNILPVSVYSNYTY